MPATDSMAEPLTPPQPRVLSTTMDESILTTEDLSAAAGAPPTTTEAPLNPPHGYDTASITDLGWHEDPENIEHLVDGISNDEVFKLIRRFNKVVWFLKDGSNVPASGIDLEVAPEQEFAPNKMRAQLERFYIDVVGTSGYQTFCMALTRFHTDCACPGYCKASGTTAILE